VHDFITGSTCNPRGDMGWHRFWGGGAVTAKGRAYKIYITNFASCLPLRSGQHLYGDYQPSMRKIRLAKFVGEYFRKGMIWYEMGKPNRLKINRTDKWEVKIKFILLWQLNIYIHRCSKTIIS
jgi:hypothetical protein